MKYSGIRIGSMENVYFTEESNADKLFTTVICYELPKKTGRLRQLHDKSVAKNWEIIYKIKTANSMANFLILRSIP